VNQPTLPARFRARGLPLNDLRLDRGSFPRPRRCRPPTRQLSQRTMPARTLSASPDRLPQFVPSSQAYFYRPRPSRSSPTRRDPRANPRDSERAPPAVSVPLHLLPMDTPERPLLSHSRYGTLDTVYPPDPVPYPSQAPAYSWSSYRNGHVLVPSYAAQMHHHSSIPPGPHHPQWHPHVRLQPVLPPPPPPIAHKVWILDCKSCGIFFTNRGMKVSTLDIIWF